MTSVPMKEMARERCIRHLAIVGVVYPRVSTQWAFGPILVMPAVADSWRRASAVANGAWRARAIWAAARAYVIAPTGINALDVGYSHLNGGLQFDGAAPITGAHADISLAAIGYYH